MIGQTLDRYEIEAKLGEGGMGVVYRARDTHLGRIVAVKVLPPDKVSNPDRKRRFIQEAKAASALNHPGIVTVHDIRSDVGIDFIVMEHVSGKTLDRIIPPTGLSVPQALRYGSAIADALAKAHEAGIIHRDVKPSNVMVTDDDRVKILDFGLAKLVDSAEGTEGVNTHTAALTEDGTILGTAAYMSPEQAEGRTLDARSDIFSFGSVLYEMVTGRRPFLAESPLSTLTKIINEDPPPPGRLAAAVSPDLERTILRCLRKDPTRRYQTMADLKVVLDDLATEPASDAPAPAPVVRAPRRPAWLWAAVIPIGLLLAAALFAARTWRTPDSAAPLRAVPLISLQGDKRSPSFSVDGNQIAFSWNGPAQNNVDVYVQQIGTGSPVRLTSDPADDDSPLWSPDGRSIAFLRERPNPLRQELRLVSPLGGSERKVTELRPRGGFLRPFTLAWCPDSSCVVVTDSTGESGPDALFVVSVESGEKRQLTTPQGVLGDTDPAVSPDGKWLVFRRDAAPFTGGLYRVELNGDVAAIGEPTRLTPTDLSANNPRWLPDSAEIVFAAREGLWRLRVLGDGQPTRLPFVGEDGLMPAVARSQPGQPARLAYVRNFTDTNIWRIDTAAPGQPAASPPTVAVSSTRRDNTPQLSPDGGRVTFTSNRTGELEVWVADATGANATQLTYMRRIPGFSRWSPDGESIAFHSNPDGQGDVLVVSAGGGKPRNVTANPANDVFPCFSRDGRWIYFSSTRTGQSLIWKVPASGGVPLQVSTRPGLLAIESVDGAYLYFVESSVTDQPGPLMRMPVKGGPPVKILDDVISTSFEVLEGGIYYLERVSGEARLRYFDFASSTSRLVARNLGEIGFGLTASRDGRTILYSRKDAAIDDLMLVEHFR